MKRVPGVLLKSAGLMGLLFSLFFVTDGSPLWAAEPIKIRTIKRFPA